MISAFASIPIFTASPHIVENRVNLGRDEIRRYLENGAYALGILCHQGRYYAHPVAAQGRDRLQIRLNSGAAGRSVPAIDNTLGITNAPFVGDSGPPADRRRHRSRKRRKCRPRRRSRRIAHRIFHRWPPWEGSCGRPGHAPRRAERRAGIRLGRGRKTGPIPDSRYRRAWSTSSVVDTDQPMMKSSPAIPLAFVPADPTVQVDTVGSGGEGNVEPIVDDQGTSLPRHAMRPPPRRAAGWSPLGRATARR